MPNKMLIDATHPEETRVVVVRGNRVEDFDFEAANKKQLRGNIYLAKVTRVEPSLQAAFVEYGGNRHGFLAFSEIHPDYYQIPAEDRERLLEEEEAAAREEERQERRRRQSRPARGPRPDRVSEPMRGSDDEDAPRGAAIHDDDASDLGDLSNVEEVPHHEDDDQIETVNGGDFDDQHEETSSQDDGAPSEPEFYHEPEELRASFADEGESRAHVEHHEDELHLEDTHFESRNRDDGDEDHVESVGSEDALEEVPERRFRRMRQYKIQEVIKRRQVLLVQVVKEERGNKGAALTTYLSLAGRYSVLMPNSGRGGGISRKITNLQDRKRLKQVAEELEVPDGMGVILRTAGAARTKAEIKRDFEYLMRLWDNVRDLTLKSTAPSLVYEEGSLVKRSIRDLYNKDIDEVLVAGEAGYREAKDFMRMLMPSHSRNVVPYRDVVPIFARFGVEPQLDAMFSPQVTLRSGGYIVINQTEALVSIDVNSGRSTREHNIEDTALATNLEAADEVARQLRLRDLAGLIVIDFIDMEEMRNNKAVERRLKEALKNDRARIQVGRISHFGLMEMSRQRIRTGVLEGSTEVCPHCLGAGIVRSTESVALHVLRALEDFLLKGVTHHVTVHTRTHAALYILNQKRAHLADLEGRFGLHVSIAADDHIGGQHFAFERGELIINRPPLVLPTYPTYEPDPEDEIDPLELEDDDDFEEGDDASTSSTSDRAESAADDANKRRRRRRRRRRPGDRAEPNGAQGSVDGEDEGDDDGTETDEAVSSDTVVSEDGTAEDEAARAEGEAEQRRRRRRGRRGGRRGRGDRPELAADGSVIVDDEGEEASPEEVIAEGESSVQDEPAETLEHPPIRLNLLDREAAAQAFDSGAISDRPDDSIRGTSALVEAVPAQQTFIGADIQAAPVAMEAVAPPVAELAVVTPILESVAQPPAPVEPKVKIEQTQIVASEPKVSTTTTDEPKRTGWWARRGGFL